MLSDEQIAELRHRANVSAGNNAVICMEIGRLEWDSLLDAHADAVRLREALERLSRLGNGDRPGNSDGNRIAQAALRPAEQGGKEAEHGA